MYLRIPFARLPPTALRSMHAKTAKNIKAKSDAHCMHRAGQQTQVIFPESDSVYHIFVFWPRLVCYDTKKIKDDR